MGLPREPIAELTKLGWIILLPGKENSLSNILFTKTSLHDYENLCSLDCLGIEEEDEKNNEFVYREFRKQVKILWELWNQLYLERKSSSIT